MSDDMPVAMKAGPTTIIIANYGFDNFEACVQKETTCGVGRTRASAIRQLALMRPGVFCVDNAVNQANKDKEFGEKVLADPAKYNVIIDERRDPQLDE